MEKAIRILLVDDDPLTLSAHARLFTKLGFSVTTANSGENALDKMERTGFDFVISDYDMPGMNGIEFHGRLDGFPADRFILIGADVGLYVKAYVEEHNLTLFDKPVELNEISNLIRTRFAS